MNYVGGLAILSELDKASDLSADTIRDAMMGIDIPVGTTAAGIGIKFGENNQNERAIMMGMQWQDGELVTVYPEEASVAEMRINQ